MHGGGDCQRAAHAKPHDRDLAARALQVLRRAPQILMRGIRKIEIAHQMVRLVRHGGQPALVEVRRERIVPGAGKPGGDAADLVVEPPPLLDDDDPRAPLPGSREIAFWLAAIRAANFDHGPHAMSPLVAVARQDAAASPTMQSVAPPPQRPWDDWVPRSFYLRAQCHRTVKMELSKKIKTALDETRILILGAQILL